MSLLYAATYPEQFLTGRRHAHEPERVLATVLSADIAGSTARAATLGDNSWRELLIGVERKLSAHSQSEARPPPEHLRSRRTQFRPQNQIAGRKEFAG